ncbi:MAG: SDR family NAD(P)-dependent oxidoreductase [Sphingopyxis sp.]|uniref:SDR family NAD(P)-dependent oxidoreductase n=1 Tax=Sphingopyxis sp. TaxID=1908224 RepID=UPI0032EC2729
MAAATERRVAVVTGASRGAGAGIARALGDAGYIVYVTGRTVAEGTADLPGTIGATAAAVTERGGQGVAVALDHRDDAAVAALFADIAARHERLDILVNNAAAVTDDLLLKRPFWEKPLSQVDIIDVGLRSAYVASYFAAPLLTRGRSGLVAFTSSFGANCYMHGPAYGAQKAGVDKLAADMAVDFADHGVAAVSIWMGPLLTERTLRPNPLRGPEYDPFFETAETPEFTGRLIAALYDSTSRMALSGRALIGAELAREWGMTDAEGRQPPSHRAMLGAPPERSRAIVR